MVIENEFDEILFSLECQFSLYDPEDHEFHESNGKYGEKTIPHYEWEYEERYAMDYKGMKLRGF